MSSFGKETKTFNSKRLFIALAALSFIFALNTCDMPMGLGDPIDWEPPVLTLDPGYPNPLYVRLGTMLAGTVTDNIGVKKVILRDANNTDVEMFEANLLPNNRWEIALDFSEEQNGEKIAVEIIAFDIMGNSGDVSIAAITLIIDIRSPIIQDIWISRTAVKNAYLETYHELYDLERTDPYGQYGTLSANVNSYQNGFFYINGKVSEEETRIEVLGLSIYDADRDPDNPLPLTPGEGRFSLPKSDGSDYAPRWLVKEEDILNAGELLWPGYKTNYYEEGSRYYYRVAIYAVDRSGNEGESIIIEDQGFFCMWEKGDEPKGIIDRLVGTVVTKGATIPVEFFDDDTLDWAYIGLLTREQWNGERDIAPGTRIPDTDNDGKLLWLKERLRNAGDVFDWKFDKKPLVDQQKVADQIAGKTFDERIIYVQTGNDDNDTGAYVLFTLTADRKLDPHTGNGAMDTNKPRWKGRAWYVDVIDENAPLIVFDTVNTGEEGYDPEDHTGSPNKEPNAAARTGDSPEENTFPKLAEGSDGNGGRYFEINGYTLRAYREDQEIQSSVVKFRMAWIPFGMDSGHPDNYITAVQNALRGANYPNSFDTLPAGIQHWEFTPEPVTGQGSFIEGTPEEIGESKFKKQVFRKRFDVLGGADDLKTAYNNFTYNGIRENETKLFVFYAEDNVGHEVFRQLRLLGNKTPPDLAVYDITGKDGINLGNNLPPNLNNSDPDSGTIYFNSSGNVDEAGRALYVGDLLAYQQYGYTAMKPVALSGTTILLTEADRTEPYQAYPRDTIIKYWVMAEKSGDLAVSSIKMEDITYSEDRRDVGYYNAGDRSLSYIEMLPEVTQRVFLFTAKDTLDNEVRIQRTVAVTNAAVLNNITTTTQSGDYGIGQTITLQANFSNLVRWTGDSPPLLNVRYDRVGSPNSTIIRQIPTKTPADNSVLFLEFDFVIDEDDIGTLQTMYYGMGVPAGNDTIRNNRPITLPAGTRILDNSRGDDAFTPRNVTGFDWTAAGQGYNKSLQGSKTITLDGIRPVITGFTLNPLGKGEPYTDSYPGYYYKADEIIQFTLEANKPIYTSGDPAIGLDIGGTWRPAAWQRADGADKMVFSVLVNDTNTPQDGTVSAIRLNNVSTIVDSVGNAFLGGGEPYPIPPNFLNSLAAIHVDKTPPNEPGTTLNGTATGNIPNPANYNASPTLAIGSTSGEHAPVAKTQYSLNNGVTWKDFPDVEPNWTSAGANGTLNILNGQWTLVTRYIDRAGNEGAVITSKAIEVNSAFPKLLGVSATTADGTYIMGRSLAFNLDFADNVSIVNANNISITLADTTNTTHNTDGTNPSYSITLSGTNVSLATNNKTLTFNWANVTGKDMLAGLKVTSLNLNGLQDKFGNAGPAAATINTTTSGTVGMPVSGDQAAYNVTYNLSGIIVSSIAPRAISYTPANAAGITGNNFTSTVSDDNKTITINFNKPMQRGRGTITVRPHGNYAIPAVLENEGYYLTVTFPTTSTQAETRSSTAGANSTYVSGMNDIYNNMTAAADRNLLITGGTLSSPSLSANTGLSVGPYKKMTHGLKTGLGYTGNYNDTNQGVNAPSPSQAASMIPDTSTKWVLDYQYQIHDTAAGTVTNIRNALTAIGFRRQEIAVTSTANVAFSNGNQTVTITLSEPLLPGLQWDLFYPEGTFTDMAGNSVAAVTDTSYWFWSRGVQTPVIRVDRKSYDGRQTVPPTGTGGAAVAQTYNDTNAYSGSMSTFNTVAYRIETETPGARIFYGTVTGVANAGSTTGNWTGAVSTTSTYNWNGPKTTATGGVWVQPNLILRNSNTANFTVTENGVTVSHAIRGGGSNAGGTFAANYYGLRSFNRDALLSELSNPTLTSGDDNMYAGSFNYDNSGLQASKNYVMADARIDHGGTPTYTSPRGYEGVFRTVIALNQNGLTTGNSYILLLGTNIKSGTPTIAGFPVRDGVATTDTRYLKMYYRNAAKQFYWVSTEIVSSWYMQCRGNGSASTGNGSGYMSSGDSTDWITAGYGDLSYGFDVATY